MKDNEDRRTFLGHDQYNSRKDTETRGHDLRVFLHTPDGPKHLKEGKPIDASPSDVIEKSLLYKRNKTTAESRFGGIPQTEIGPDGKRVLIGEFGAITLTYKYEENQVFQVQDGELKIVQRYPDPTKAQTASTNEVLLKNAAGRYSGLQGKIIMTFPSDEKDNKKE